MTLYFSILFVVIFIFLRNTAMILFPLQSFSPGASAPYCSGFSRSSSTLASFLLYRFSHQVVFTSPFLFPEGCSRRPVLVDGSSAFRATIKPTSFSFPLVAAPSEMVRPVPGGLDLPRERPAIVRTLVWLSEYLYVSSSVFGCALKQLSRCGSPQPQGSAFNSRVIMVR